MWRKLLHSSAVGYLAGAAAIALVVAACAPFAGRLSDTTVAMAVLLVVLFAAILWGSGPALATSVLGALAFDYFFLPPFGTLVIASAENWGAFAALLVTAVTVGELSAHAKQRAAESQLASAYNRRLIEASLDALVAIGRDGKITDVNTSTEAITGRSRGTLIGTDFADYFTDPGRARAGYRQAFEGGSLRDYPLDIRRPDGSGVPVLYNASAYRDEAGRIVGVIAAARDISGIERAEREIRRLASFPQLAPIPIIEFDAAMEMRFANPAMLTTLKECGVEDPRAFIPSQWQVRLAEGPDADASESAELEIAGRTFDERIFFARASRSLRIWAVEITERKQAELALESLNRTLRTLSSANQALVHAKSEPELLHAMCQVLVDVGGCRMAWIGLAEDNPERTVRVAAVAGHDEGYTAQARISWADDERGRGPTGTAIRSGEPQVNLNFVTNPRMAPWRDEALKRGYASSAALPLKQGNRVIGALTIYAGKPEAIDEGQLDLFVELASDLAYGIAALRGADERQAAVQRFYDSLEDTVGAIASTIEIRDPYTAGHQRRVARLAAAIARELGLPEDQARGIFLAGLIHDVGKINVPSEILAKPSTLSPLEIQFIQTHAQSGRDIIKDVDFPWPIAEAVLQHHERLDGSGYPRGLAGDAIIIEARILAVADVVESIMTHRPYRAAIGIDAALDELATGKGKLYDPAVVEACGTLFRQKGFRLQ